MNSGIIKKYIKYEWNRNPNSFNYFKEKSLEGVIIFSNLLKFLHFTITC